MCILSVIVPSYNVEKYLKTNLSSFDDERFNELLEILIVNDGSTDSTVSIAQEFVKKNPSVFKLINKENGGHGSAVNVGISSASGKYFRVVDGDDWVNTENLLKLLEYLKSVDFDLICDVKREIDFRTHNSLLFPLPKCVEKNKVYTISEIASSKELSSYIMMHTVTIKTEILKKNYISLLEHTFYVDYEYIVKSVCCCNTINFVDIEIYQYLVGNINQSVNYLNYANRYYQHYRVLKVLLDYELKNSDALNFYSIKLISLINTHYKILLIMMPNKNEGRKLAKEFNKELENNYKFFYVKTLKRYKILSLLNKLHIDFNLFNFINSVRRK